MNKSIKMTKSGYLKHKEIIDQWLEGKEIQLEVHLWGGKTQWEDCSEPDFLEWQNYRIKTEGKIKSESMINKIAFILCVFGAIDAMYHDYWGFFIVFVMLAALNGTIGWRDVFKNQNQ